MDVARVLAALAELAPPGADRVLDVTRGGQPIVWLAAPERGPRRALDRLAALDALHSEERILRRGWGFLAGRVTVDGVARKVRVPLLSEPVRLERQLAAYRVVPAGDLEVTPLVVDRALAAAFESAPGVAGPGWPTAVGALAWLRSVAGATGLTVSEERLDGDHRRLPNDGVALVVAAAVYVSRDVFGTALGDALRSWASRPGLDRTALAALYGDGGFVDSAAAAAGRAAAADGEHRDRDEPLSPLPLTAAQADVVRRARTAQVTVVSGPPGNGKSHAVVAAALDVVHHGGSVLVATQSSHAADVLADLLARYPGPAPVLFGNAERRTELAAGLAAGVEAGTDEGGLRADRAAVAAAAATLRRARDAVAAALDVERAAAALPRWQPLLSELTSQVPGAFDGAADLGHADRLLDRAGGAAGGWWARWRAAGALRRARRLLRAGNHIPLHQLSTAVAASGAVRAAGLLAARGGTDLSPLWVELHAAEDALAAEVGHAMRRAARSRTRWSADGRRMAAGLAAALRAGRNRRRELLAALDGPPLVQALPLWVGTVSDVEDLLPPVPGLFDLVVLDEASHTDQVRAAPVLARARRALVVGDPRQLRFVSFVSDVDVDAALRRHGVDERADVRRVSAFDLAAAAAPPIWLNEHHRCAPHLIGFSAGRFYGGRIAVATRHPRTEAADVIDVVRVQGKADADGVNAAEVVAVVDAVRALAAGGVTGIGAVSPFRSQADAIEAALLDAFPADDIGRLRLRTGTVHAFQGSEADVVVASLGVAPGDPAARARFLDDPHLFNVLVTRARRRMVVVTSLTDADGLVGAYLRYAEAPPVTPSGDVDRDPWRDALAAALERLGIESRVGYPVGSWRLDLCVGPPARAIGVTCAVHPGGVAAHLARQQALRRAGWELRDAFASRFGGDPVRAALELGAGLA